MCKIGHRGANFPKVTQQVMTEVGFKHRQSGSRAHVLNDYTSKSLVKERVLLLLKEWKTIALREPSQEQSAKEKVDDLCFLLALLLLGSSWQEKVSGIRSQMRKHREAPTAVLLSALDETACEYRFVDAVGCLGSPQPPSLLGPAAQDSSPSDHRPMGSESSVVMACGN